jgi:hypothetical protein
MQLNAKVWKVVYAPNVKENMMRCSRKANSMTFKSPRNRPICRDQACDVEIHAGEKYCAAHSWRIGKWLDRSHALLIKAQQTDNKNFSTFCSFCRKDTWHLSIKSWIFTYILCWGCGEPTLAWEKASDA